LSSQIVCISGWGQNFQSLQPVFSSGFFSKFSTSSLNYYAFDNINNFFESTKKQKIYCQILVGWSLGGQLALRMLEKKIISTDLLILIAPPFQMIKNQRISSGMSPTTFNQFYQNFITEPDLTLKKFSILTAMNDRNQKEIARSLEINKTNFIQLKFWLEELSRFSCFDLDFSQMPKTLYFHGAGDMIVHISQMEYFKQRIESFFPYIFKNCGHAPHLNNQELFCKNIIDSLS
jgi:pimeloyl-ACP methyl ester carboxylesterase